MEMLKKMALVLVLSGSCGLQAMFVGDVEWYNTNDPWHVTYYPEMYEDGVFELKEEYNTPEKIAALRAIRDAAGQVDLVVAPPVAPQQAAEGSLGAELRASRMFMQAMAEEEEGLWDLIERFDARRRRAKK